MSIVSTQPVLTHLKDRLRANLVEPELVSDPDLLQLVSEAYQDACVRSRCLRTYTTITFTGADSYALPDAWFETSDVFYLGRVLPEVAHRDMAGHGGGFPLWRSHTGRSISFTPTPADGSAVVDYAEMPPAFASWGDTLDPRFPPERAYLLVHHVRWQVLTMMGGAQRIGTASWEHSQYDAGVAELRRQARNVDSVGPNRIRLNDKDSLLAG